MCQTSVLDALPFAGRSRLFAPFGLPNSLGSFRKVCLSPSAFLLRSSREFIRLNFKNSTYFTQRHLQRLWCQPSRSFYGLVFGRSVLWVLLQLQLFHSHCSANFLLFWFFYDIINFSIMLIYYLLPDLHQILILLVQFHSIWFGACFCLWIFRGSFSSLRLFLGEHKLFFWLLHVVFVLQPGRALFRRICAFGRVVFLGIQCLEYYI